MKCFFKYFSIYLRRRRIINIVLATIKKAEPEKLQDLTFYERINLAIQILKTIGGDKVWKVE